MKDVIPLAEEDSSTDSESYSDDQASFEAEFDDDSDSSLESYSELLDTDSDDDGVNPVSEAKIIFRVIHSTLAGDDAASAFTESMMSALVKSVEDVEAAGKPLPANQLTSICYNMCLFIAKSPAFQEADVFKNTLTFLNKIILKVIDNEITAPGMLTTNAFVNLICDVATKVKISNRTHLKDHAIQKCMDALNLNVDKMLIIKSPIGVSKNTGTLFFAEKKEIDLTGRNERLIYADYYIEDWDETLFDNVNDQFYPGLKALIEMSARLGVQHTIMTARSGLLEFTEQFTICDSKTGGTRDVTRTPGCAVDEYLHKVGLIDLYIGSQIHYCNFHVAYLENGKVMVASGQKAKSDKIADYHYYCLVNNIDKNKTIIFDDKIEVWSNDQGKLDNAFIVDNRDPISSTFMKMAHAIEQRILYNEQVDQGLRLQEAAVLMDLLKAKNEPHLKDLISELKSFVGRHASPRPVG
jgi:hypothetical protein